MTWRLYVIPVIGTGSSHLDQRRPAYVVEAGLAQGSMDYGAIPWCLCAADVTAAQHAALVANADVAAFPSDLSREVGGALAATQAALENARIPAGWVTSTTSFSVVARVVAGLMQFGQRYTGLTGGLELMPAGVNLNTQFGALSAQRQADILATADSFGYATAGLQPTTTLRAILKNLADQWGVQGFTIGGLSF